MYWIISFFIPKEKITPRDLGIILTAGFLGMVVTQISFTVGISFTTPVTMSLIGALGPITVLLLSAILLAETLSIKNTIGVILGISGAVIIVLHNGSGGVFSNNILGILLAMVSVIAQAVYYIIIRKIAGKYLPVTMMKWMFLLGFIFLSPLGIPELPKQRIFTSEVTLLPIIQLGFGLFFACALAVFLLPVALKHIKATTASMYTNLQPLVASSAAIIVGQDVLTWDKPLALVLIVSGVLIITQNKSPKKNN
jgi:drug/metabolite transporter (DMT)-like permease